MTRAYTLVVLGFGWLAVDLWIVVEDVILRETLLGVVAKFLDRFPPRISEPVFLALWVLLLFGWMIPPARGIRTLLRHRN